MHDLRRCGLLAAGIAAAVCLPAPAAAQPAADAPQVTFAKDIAPILQRSCQQCHRLDSVAPMSLLTYEEARPWARAIKARTQLRNKRGAMPPWFLEKDIGIQHYKNDPSLSEEEIGKIAVWADSGAPLGNPADLPLPLDFGDENAWTIGESDLILESAEVVVPASAPDKWTSLGHVPTGLAEDRYVAAIEVREFNDVPRRQSSNTVGGRYVFHHMTYSSVIPGDGQRENSVRWPIHEVGRNADVFPPDAGRLLSAGSALDLETAHLHSNGRETRAHLKFASSCTRRGTSRRSGRAGGWWATAWTSTSSPISRTSSSTPTACSTSTPSWCRSSRTSTRPAPACAWRPSGATTSRRWRAWATTTTG